MASKVKQVIIAKISNNPTYRQHTSALRNYINEFHDEFDDVIDWNDIIFDLQYHGPDCTLYNVTKGNAQFLQYVSNLINDATVSLIESISSGTNEDDIKRTYHIKSVDVIHKELDGVYSEGNITKKFIINDSDGNVLSIGIVSDSLTVDYDKHGDIYKDNTLILHAKALESGDEIEINLNFNDKKCTFCVNDVKECDIELPRNIFRFSYKYSGNEKSKRDPIEVDPSPIDVDTDVKIDIDDTPVKPGDVIRPGDVVKPGDVECETKMDNMDRKIDTEVIRNTKSCIKKPFVIICCDNTSETKILQQLYAELYGSNLNCVSTSNNNLGRIKNICKRKYAAKKKTFDSVIIIVGNQANVNDTVKINPAPLTDMFIDPNKPTILFQYTYVTEKQNRVNYKPYITIKAEAVHTSAFLRFNNIICMHKAMNALLHKHIQQM